ncbi:hypothetical protein [Acetobacter conturbans]|uniref:hypothetical protein n=1 Tax=Acetobacter conturbans TaxID=1737472 RepID=UPI001568040F|nr:hypothetical protein [Acetobacter conturbans]
MAANTAWNDAACLFRHPARLASPTAGHGVMTTRRSPVSPLLSRNIAHGTVIERIDVSCIA